MKTVVLVTNRRYKDIQHLAQVKGETGTEFFSFPALGCRFLFAASPVTKCCLSRTN